MFMLKMYQRYSVLGIMFIWKKKKSTRREYFISGVRFFGVNFHVLVYIIYLMHFLLLTNPYSRNLKLHMVTKGNLKLIVSVKV